jgi:hypothetical protein
MLVHDDVGILVSGWIEIDGNQQTLKDLPDDGLDRFLRTKPAAVSTPDGTGA